MRKDGFARCYLEAWIYWIGLNLVAIAIEEVSAGLFRLPTLSASNWDMFLDPVSLVAQGLLLIPLFAAILAGIRRPSGRAD